LAARVVNVSDVSATSRFSRKFQRAMNSVRRVASDVQAQYGIVEVRYCENVAVAVEIKSYLIGFCP